MDIVAHLSNVAPGPCVKATARNHSPFTVLKFPKTNAVNYEQILCFFTAVYLENQKYKVENK